jgi:hypothetical protein
MSRIADMRRDALANWQQVIADTVPGGFRYAMMLVAPALAALVAGGAQVIGEIFPSSLGGAHVDQLRVFAALLAPWTVAALLVNLLLPAMFALDRARLVNGVAPALIAVHLAATAVGGALFGVNGAVGAFFVAPASFAAVLLIAAPGGSGRAVAPELLRDGLRFALLAGGCFAAGAAAGAAVPGIASGIVAVGVGGVLYVLATSRLAPSQIRMLVGSVRPASA